MHWFKIFDIHAAFFFMIKGMIFYTKGISYLFGGKKGYRNTQKTSVIILIGPKSYY